MNKNLIRYLIWVYFFLIIFEGALRRWIFPSLSDPLLLIRDPIAALILILGSPILFNESNRTWIFSIFSIGLIGSVLTMIFGHQDWLITLWAARIPLLHFPLIFIIPEIITKSDFFKIRNCMFIISIPMTILLIAQYLLPSDHWVNIGTGGEGTAGFGNVFGKARPPGTFSFISGTNYFYLLLSSFFFSSISDSKRRFPLWAYIVPPCIIVSLIFSISRSAIFDFLSVLAATLFINSITKKITTYLKFIFFAGLILLVSSNLILKSSIAQEALSVTEYRWDQANKFESQSDSSSNFIGALIHRLYLDAFFNEISDSHNFFGYGIGFFSHPARFRIPEYRENIYKNTDYLEEATYIYTLLEYGLILGFMFLLWKFLLFKKIITQTFKYSVKNKDNYSFIISICSFKMFMFGWLDQPNSLGFVVFICGLTLATTNFNKQLSRELETSNKKT